MAKFTLDDIRKAAEAKYGSLDIELADGSEVSLMNPMRMPKEKRKALGSLQGKLSALQDADEEELAEVDEGEVIGEILSLICSTEGQAKKLLKALGDDMAMKVEVFNMYGEFTQAGEA